MNRYIYALLSVIFIMSFSVHKSSSVTGAISTSTTTCSCGRSFQQYTSLLQHCNRNGKTSGCTPAQIATKARKFMPLPTAPTPRSPIPRRANLPPVLGGDGHTNQHDNLFEAESGTDSNDEVILDQCHDDDNESVGSSVTCDEEEETNFDTLGYEDATGDEFLEAYKQLNMAVKMGKEGALTRLMKLMTCDAWGRLDLARIVKDSKLDDVHEILKDMRTNLEKEMGRQKFRKVKVKNPLNEKEFVVMWCKDSCGALQEQLQKAVTKGKHRNFYTKAFEARNRKGFPCVSHPMNGRVALETTKQIMRRIRNDTEVHWRTPRVEKRKGKDGRSSTILYGQLYSDVSSHSLSTNSMAFYPFHMTFLNWSTSTKDDLVVNGDAVLAYLPTNAKWEVEPNSAHETNVDYFGYQATAETVEYNFFSDDDSESESDRSEDLQDSSPKPRFETEDKPKDMIYATCFEVCMRAVKATAKAGLKFEDAHDRKWLGHLCIASYVADHPEARKIACVREKHCHLCMVARKEQNLVFSELLMPERRDPNIAKRLNGEREEARREEDTNKRSEAGKRMDEHHLRRCSSALADWPFNDLKGLGMYEIFRYEFMHVHVLGNFRHEAEIVISLLMDKKTKTNNGSRKNKKTHAHELSLHVPKPIAKSKSKGKSKKGEKKKPRKHTYSSKKMMTLKAANRYLRNIENEWPAIGYHIDFTRDGLVGDLDGFFRAKGLASMLQATHLKDLMEVMPFVGALVDRLVLNIPVKGRILQSQEIEPLLTGLYVKLADLSRAITKKDKVDRSFAEPDIAHLRHCLNDHNDYLLRPEICNYQKTKFNHIKRHEENCHLISAIEELGPVFNYDAGVWETSHLGWKFHYRLGSKRHSSAMEETLELMAMSKFGRDLLDKAYTDGKRGRLIYFLVTGKRAPKPTRQNKLKVLAATSDTCQLGSWGRSFTGHELHSILTNISSDERSMKTFLSEEGMQKLHSSKTAKSGQYHANYFIHQCGGPNFLAKPAWDIISRKALAHVKAPREGQEQDFEEEQYGALQSLKLKMITSAYIPGLDPPTLGDVHDDDGQTSGTLQLRDNFERHIQRCIAASKFSHGKKRWQDCVTIEAAESDDTPYRTTWVAKVLCFLRITSPEGHYSNPSEECVAVVRYFDVLPKSQYSRIDKALGCVKMRWATTAGGEDPWVDVVPLRSIRSRVHVVPDGMHYLTEAEAAMYVPTAPDWKNRFHYVNRFKLSHYEPKYMVHDAVESGKDGEDLDPNESASSSEGDCRPKKKRRL